MNELEARYQTCRAARKGAQRDEALARLALERWRRARAFEHGQLLSFGHVHRRCLVDKAHVTVPLPDQIQHPNALVTILRLCWVETARSLARREFAVPGFACHVDKQARLCLIEARPSLTGADKTTLRELGLTASHPLEFEDSKDTVLLEFSTERGQETASLSFWGVGLSMVCGPSSNPRSSSTRASSLRLLSDLGQEDLQTWICFIDGLLRRQLNS